MLPEISVSMIVARGRNGVIGNEGHLPWRLRSDLASFKALTLGKPIIMGRATWESFPRRPLPGRENIVLSRDWNYSAPGARVYSNLSVGVNVARAMAKRAGQDEVFIIGGGAVYELGMSFADRLYITEVDAAPEGDVFFPDFEVRDWQEVSRQDCAADDRNDHAFSMVVLERVRVNAPCV